MTRLPFPVGSGVFETMRTEDGKVAELSRHMRRALKSCLTLGIPFPEEDAFRRAIARELEATDIQVGRLRVTFDRNGFLATHTPYEDSNLLARLTFHSTSQVERGEQLKCYPYDHRFEILDGALDMGFDDAIIFNKDNEVTETSIANIALKISDQWITPPIAAGILPGVMRALAIEELDVKVESLHISQIPLVESACLLNSLKLAQPVSHIGDFQLPEIEHSLTFEAKLREKVQYFSVL